MSKHLRRTLQCRHSDRLVSLEGPEAYPPVVPPPLTGLEGGSVWLGNNF